MKSYLPIFLLIGGVLVLSLVGFVVFNLRSKETPGNVQAEKVVKELSLDKRPYITLTPNSAGNILSLSVSRIPNGVDSLEYELVYNTAAGVVQGVPGSIALGGKTSFARELTLGTCSSGVCRYDKGVKDITFTIRLRDTRGKLISKLSTGIELLSKTKELSSTDKKFTLALDRSPSGYYVVMQTGGIPGQTPDSVINGPYGVFASSSQDQKGKVDLAEKVYGWTGTSWNELTDGQTNKLGVFVGVE